MLYSWRYHKGVMRRPLALERSNLGAGLELM
jgi:hypothetical protein